MLQVELLEHKIPPEFFLLIHQYFYIFLIAIKIFSVYVKLYISANVIHKSKCIPCRCLLVLGVA